MDNSKNISTHRALCVKKGVIYRSDKCFRTGSIDTFYYFDLFIVKMHFNKNIHPN